MPQPILADRGVWWCMVLYGVVGGAWCMVNLLATVRAECRMFSLYTDACRCILAVMRMLAILFRSRVPFVIRQCSAAHSRHRTVHSRESLPSAVEHLPRSAVRTSAGQEGRTAVHESHASRQGRARTHTRKHARTHARPNARTHAHTHGVGRCKREWRGSVQSCTSERGERACTCTRTHTHSLTHTHTHTHTHKHTVR